MGAFMANAGLLPDRVLCSTARRAVETWDLVAEHLGGSSEVELRDDLYHASAWSLLPILQGLPNSEDVVLLVGHNPTFEDLALTLAGAGAPECLTELNRKYPTGALAVIDFSVGRWQELRAGEGFLRDFVRPRTLEP
jgi:phosphohistidine phosphatase